MNEPTTRTTMTDSRRRGAQTLVAALALCWVQQGFGQPQMIDEIIGEQAEAEAIARGSQIRVAQLDEEATQLLAEYRQVIAEADNLETYNEQVAAQVTSQDDEIEAMLRQLEQIETTASEVMPMMQRMLETLEQFVELDVPFLLDEREARVQMLKDLMRRADVSVSEKYRRIIEAYGVEMEYGRTIESYRGDIDAGEEPRTVDFLRVGRVALMFQTLDGKETGYWDEANQTWVTDDDYRSYVRDGLRIAKQQAAPDLMILPVSSPKESTL